MVNIEKHLMELETCKKDNKKRGNIFTVAMLEQSEYVTRELLKYKELEKQGLLVNFPCKIGDTVWLRACCECVVVHREYGAITCPFEDECESEECNNGVERIFKTTVENIFNNGQGWHFTAKHIDVEIPMLDIGRTVLLSEDEVKQKWGSVS